MRCRQSFLTFDKMIMVKELTISLHSLFYVSAALKRKMLEILQRRMR